MYTNVTWRHMTNQPLTKGAGTDRELLCASLHQSWPIATYDVLRRSHTAVFVNTLLGSNGQANAWPVVHSAWVVVFAYLMATVAELVKVPYQWSEDHGFESWLILSWRGGLGQSPFPLPLRTKEVTVRAVMALSVDLIFAPMSSQAVCFLESEMIRHNDLG